MGRLGLRLSIDNNRSANDGGLRVDQHTVLPKDLSERMMSLRLPNLKVLLSSRRCDPPATFTMMFSFPAPSSYNELIHPLSYLESVGAAGSSLVCLST